ncbi:MAG: hypothetical protein UZ21_OP11001000686 [Microgenomates bacterium OLB22]|nr:MAG: hypothetical protein UZ21_OP11001000686 [Microgenomates bacterium OLB22]
MHRGVVNSTNILLLGYPTLKALTGTIMSAMQIPRPALILIAMSAIACLLAMFRLGQYTQKLNSIHVLPSPSMADSPIPTMSSKPKTTLIASEKTCGLSFLYPSDMEIKSVSSQSALLTNMEQLIQLTCIQQDVFPIASPEGTVTVAGRRAAYRSDQKDVTNYLFDVPRIGKVQLTVHDSLKELVTRTLSIITPTIVPTNATE